MDGIESQDNGFSRLDDYNRDGKREQEENVTKQKYPEVKPGGNTGYWLSA